MSETYCVYKHTCPNGKAYIGITKNVEQRWNLGHGYDTQLFGRAVKKYGWNNIEHEILFDGLAKEEAEKKEIELIDEYHLTDRKYGYNIMLGGQSGTSGIDISEETRKKMSENAKQLWKKEPIRNKLLLHLAEISKNNIGRKMPESAIEATRKALSIKVDQYDLNGNLVKTFDSLIDAAKSVGKGTNSAIVGCCKGRRKTYSGFIWKYHDDSLSEEELIERTSRKSTAKPIVMCTKDGVEVKRFNGIHEAGRVLGINYKAIFCAIKTGRNCNGYKWKYSTEV